MNSEMKSCQEKILDRVKSLLYDKQGDANGEICRADFTV